MTADESHEAWLAVFAAVTGPPPDRRQAPCPHCGYFDIHFQYVAEPESRVGFCALWCDNCRHGHVLSRVRVPEQIDFLPLDAPEQRLREAIPAFWDAAAAATPTDSHSESAIAARLAELRPQVAEYELLKGLEDPRNLERRLLSRREHEIAQLLREGLSVQAIAQQLGVSGSTVHTLIQRIYWKLGRDAARPQFF